jgi:hypothetical protein
MAGWGSKGKNHNVGLMEPGRLGAAPWQYETLKRLDRRRSSGLTFDEAAERIKEAYDRRAKERAGLTTTEEFYIEALWRKAIKVANDAGEKWLSENPKIKFVINAEEYQVGVHGEIGRAWLSWPPRRTPIYKWLVENYFPRTENKREVHVPHKFVERYELGLQLACVEASFKVFRNGGLNLGEMKMMVQSDVVPQLQAA